MAINFRLAAVIAFVIPTFALAEAPQLPRLPQAKTVEQVDNFFGTNVADPYRWMEKVEAPEVRAFIDAHNARVRVYVDGPAREKFKARMTELYNFARQSAPTRRGKLAFYNTNTGLQNQGVNWVTDTIGDSGRVLIDPNKLSEDGTVSLSGVAYTVDGSLMAYQLAQRGSDHSEIRVKNVVTGADLPDILPPARQGVTGWLPDKSGFYYGKFPTSGGNMQTEVAYGYQLFLHKLGTPATQDKLVYERPDDKELSFGISLTEDGKYEIMSLRRGTSPNNRWYVREYGQGDWKKIVDEEVASYRPVENDGSTFYVVTTDDAQRKRLVAIDVNNPARENWQELIPQSDDTLESVKLVGDRFVAVYAQDAKSILKLFKKDGSFDKQIELPTVGAVGGISGRKEDADFFYTFTSFNYPSTSFRHELSSGKSTVHFAPTVAFNPDDYESRQIFATSKDGAKVPVFVTHKKGLKLDGNNPTILNGYGGFTAGQRPGFSPTRIAWLESGGVFALACLRGGDEYGEAWHSAGMLDKKQNVFDDLHACAEELAKQGYTSSKKLAVQGGSNGGLLVAAAVTQRPELYGAVVCQVPVIDMLRYHRLGIGRFWIPEYGNADASSDQFAFLHAYSPLHNIKSGAAYPPILITTGEGDNRVVPAHSVKFAATLAAKASSQNLLLMRVETKAGHGGGKPTSKILDEGADVYAFLMKVFGM